ncbi:MAG: hypothetical protein WC875_01725 [Candidatus Absconditabacterales bacterium]
MAIFFEVIKGIFFFLTIMVGLFFLRGSILISPEYYTIVKQLLIPGYLVFCGMMFGYIMSRLRLGYDEDHPQKMKIYVRSFITGVIIGIVLAVIYIFI